MSHSDSDSVGFIDHQFEIFGTIFSHCKHFDGNWHRTDTLLCIPRIAIDHRTSICWRVEWFAVSCLANSIFYGGISHAFFDSISRLFFGTAIFAYEGIALVSDKLTIRTVENGVWNLFTDAALSFCRFCHWKMWWENHHNSIVHSEYSIPEWYSFRCYSLRAVSLVTGNGVKELPEVWHWTFQLLTRKLILWSSVIPEMNIQIFLPPLLDWHKPLRWWFHPAFCSLTHCNFSLEFKSCGRRLTRNTAHCNIH